MEEGNSNGKVAIFTKDFMFKMKDMDLVKCTSLMAQYTKVIGRKVYKQDKDK